MIITVSSVRGAPGVTTWALLLGAVWPIELGAERVVLEADSAGGVLGARYGLGVEPGVVSLVSALRHLDGPLPIADHARAVGTGVWVVPGPELADQASAVWSGSSEALASHAQSDGRVWVVDCGRLDARSPQRAFLRRASYAVLVSGCRLEDLLQLPERVRLLSESTGGVGLVMVGKLAHKRQEVADFAGAEVLAVAGRQPDAIDLAGDAVSGGRARYSLLWRTALELGVEVSRRAAGSEPTARWDLRAGRRRGTA